MTRQAGDTDEIEITPDMLKAGAEALLDHHSEFESEEAGADRIFRAMLSAWRVSRVG